MLHTHDGFLELAVDHHTVSHDDDIIENDLIVGIVQGGQTVGQPCDGIGLTGTGAVLDQIILSGAIFLHIGQYTADDIQLVVARKNQVF